MAETLTYERPKATLVNVTPIVLSLLAGEFPNTPAVLASPGVTAEIDVRLQADADPEATQDVQDLFKLRLAPEMNSSGLITWVGYIVPILGNGSEGVRIPISVPHEQNMDTWQAQAGQPRADVNDEGTFGDDGDEMLFGGNVLTP